MTRRHHIATLALFLTSCQVVTGLDELAADRTSTNTSPDAGSTRDKPAQAGTRAMQTTNPVRMPQAGGKQAEAGASAPALDEDAGKTDDEPCSTRITYGSAWIRSANHTESFDIADGVVTWDGTCQSDAAGNSFAILSNGWRPFFTGKSSCVIALDAQGSCAAQAACSTRVSYGSAWFAPDGHSDSFDDIPGVITTSGQCKADDDESYVVLSNGWQPHFMGQDSCAVSLRYTQCNGLFANPVVTEDCPDPGLLWDNDRWVMACTAEHPQLSLRSSRDLVHWKLEGSIFSDATKPQWAERDFWSPELHRVGDQYLALFNARQADGESAIGVATAQSVLGPYQARGEPLLIDSPGAIDPHLFTAPDGAHYLVWKHEGNTRGGVASIKLQPLSEDGLAVTGSPTTILTNTEPWEGTHIHTPWLSFFNDNYYLFYSADDASSNGSSIAVARAKTLLGPYSKPDAPSIVSAGDWTAPTVGSVVNLGAGTWFLVFHAWPIGSLGATPPGRQVMLSRIRLSDDDWPTLLGAPSSLSQPMP